MTPKQKDLAKLQASLDTRKLLHLFNWFIRESGHPGYENAIPPEECPIPRIIEDPANANNTDEDEDDGVEPTFEGATFHFTSGHEPDDNTGVYGSTQNFIQAMLQRTMPTLLVQR